MDAAEFDRRLRASLAPLLAEYVYSDDPDAQDFHDREAILLDEMVAELEEGAD